NERRPRHAQCHRLRIMAVQTGHGVLDQRLALVVLHVPGFLVRHAGNQHEAFRHVTLAGEAVQRQVRGVTLQAGARLLPLRHPAGLLLVEEGVGVAAAVSIVDGERVTGEDPPEPRLLVELLLGEATIARAESPATVPGRRRKRRLEVSVVLERPVLSPYLWVRGLFAHLDQPDEGLPGLLRSKMLV